MNGNGWLIYPSVSFYFATNLFIVKSSRLKDHSHWLCWVAIKVLFEKKTSPNSIHNISYLRPASTMRHSIRRGSGMNSQVNRLSRVPRRRPGRCWTLNTLFCICTFFERYRHTWGRSRMSDIAQKQVIRSFAVQCYNEKRLPAISIRTSKGRGSFTKDFLNVCWPTS